MNHILKNMTLIFANLGIFPDSNIKLGNTSIYYEEVEVAIDDIKTHILRDGFYPELIKNGKIFIQYKKNGKLHRDNNKPADIINCKDGKIICEEYYQNGKLHRDDGKPADITYEDGKIICELYYENGKHRKTFTL